MSPTACSTSASVATTTTTVVPAAPAFGEGAWLCAVAARKRARAAGERPVTRARPATPSPPRAMTLFSNAWKVRDVDTFE